MAKLSMTADQIESNANKITSGSSLTGSTSSTQYVSAKAFNEALATATSSILNQVFPVGYVMTVYNTTDYSSYLGFTWTQINGYFLYATTGKSVGTTGGSAKLQAHTHSIPALSGTAASGGAHKHVVTTKTTSYGSGTQSGWRCLSWPGTSADYDQTVYTNNGTNEGAHTHTVSTSASTSGSTGGGLASSSTEGNLPPYIAVRMWRRTA